MRQNSHTHLLTSPSSTALEQTKAQQQGEEQRLQEFKQMLDQRFLDSESPLVGIEGLLQEMGQVLLPDRCWVGFLDSQEHVTQNLLWHSNGTLESTLNHPLEWELLSKSGLRSQLVEGKVLQIPNLQEALDAQDLKRNSRKGRAKTIDAAFPCNGAVLGIQTHYQGRKNGIILLMRSQPHEWAHLDVQLLHTFAQSMAIAISQTQLEQNLQQQIRSQLLIDQLTGAIRNGCNLEQIFEMAASGVGTALHASRGLVLTMKYTNPRFKSQMRGQAAQGTVLVEHEWLADESSKTFATEKFAQSSSQSTSGAKPSFAVASCHLWQQLLAGSNEVVTWPDTQAEDCLTEAKSFKAASIFNLNALPSLLLVPIENQGKVLGGLVLQQRQPRTWQTEEILFARLVAAQLSTAIIQSHALRQFHSLVDERTAQLQHSLDVQAKLYEKTRQQVDQLRHMNAVMEEFLSTISHELLTPLTTMKLAIRMLREANLSPEQRDRYLTILEQQCTQETHLIRDLLALQKLENPELGQLQQIDLRLFVRDLYQSLAGTLAECQISLKLDIPDRPLPMRTDTDSLNRILTELITNAKKYSDAASTIHLQIVPNLDQALPHMTLKIWNTGAGITPEELPVIFEKFRRGKDATQNAIPGIGLGLALVKGLVAHLGGSISVTSEPLPDSTSWETCFVVTLPQTSSLLRES